MTVTSVTDVDICVGMIVFMGVIVRFVFVPVTVVFGDDKPLDMLNWCSGVVPKFVALNNFVVEVKFVLVLDKMNHRPVRVNAGVVKVGLKTSAIFVMSLRVWDDLDGLEKLTKLSGDLLLRYR